jgi:jumonji domain-containing protein 2
MAVPAASQAPPSDDADRPAVDMCRGTEAEMPIEDRMVVEGDTLSAPQPQTSAAGPPSHSGYTNSRDHHVEYDRDQGSSGVLRLKPTPEQWDDFPTILATARELGAGKDGCFKVVLPDGLLGPLPEKPAQTVAANAYRTHQMKRTRIWQVATIPTEGNFPPSPDETGPRFTDDPQKALERLRTLFTKNKNRQMRDVRYRVDVPAWTEAQRRAAGVPAKSPLHPLKGDKLDRTRAIIPGIHTPYVYESGPAFGATFQIHAEDFRLSSLNHLYEGRKIWIVIPSAAVDLAEEKLERRGKCSQFMRHRAEFVFPAKLDRLSIPYRTIDQRPGETIVILPDAYHEGFSTGHTLAEAKNYAEESWSADSYQPCDSSCNLPTAIPAAYMELVEPGEERIDVCAIHEEEIAPQRKRKRHEEEEELSDAEVDEREAQRPKLSAEVDTVA